jgi:hypothetical protein
VKPIFLRINNFAGSRNFFVIIILLLIVQASWYALTAQYPMAFDEDFHFGIIQLFSHQWGPFFSVSPPNSGAFGALTRDPSYLYHYLMSFPYRLIVLVTSNQVHQIITLRFINITFFATGIVMFRRLFIELGITARIINYSLLMLVLVPVTPFLAAHINYDNLLFLLLPISISLTLYCARMVRQEHRIPVIEFSLLVIVSLLTSLIKYVFLPILVAIALYLLITFIRQPSKGQLFRRSWASFTQKKLLVKVVLTIGIVVSSGLFIERDIVNVLKYHSLSPACTQVESAHHCSQYGPFARDEILEQQKQAGTTKPSSNPISFFINWSHDLLYRLFFAINYDYSTQPPLPIPYKLAFVVGLIGLTLATFWSKAIFRDNKGLFLPLGAVILYIGALFYLNYTDYLKYGERVAVNGRYFIPLLPFIFVFLGLVYSRFLMALFKQRAGYFKLLISIIALLLMLQGGGILTYLVESGPNWYWHNDTVVAFNLAAKRIVSFLIA